MGESWLYYDYLRRWWRLLLVATAIGALFGLAVFASQTRPVKHYGKAIVAIQDPTGVSQNISIPVVVVSLQTSGIASNFSRRIGE